MTSTSIPLISYYDGTRVVECKDKRVVLVGGCFDVLHYGHFEYLKNAKKYGDYLIVVLEPDTKIISNKSRLPIHNQLQRAENLTAIRFVDHVLALPKLNGYNDYHQLVINISPVVIAVTAHDSQIANKTKQAMTVGAQVIQVIDMQLEFSSTRIINYYGR